ncbi:MAG: serine/threonine-protein kinase [Myxococcota bacterium]
MTENAEMLYPGLDLGDYVLSRRLAAGGMGEVWVAERKAGGGLAEVALKMMRGASEPQVRAVWRDELAVSRRLRHENVVTVFDGFEQEPWLVQVMELVPGQDLRHVQRGLGEEPLPVQHGLYIAGCLARAMAYVHGRADPDGRPLRIIHRDISPQNVMIGCDGSVKLLDFGIARHQARENTTALKLVKGKAAYMSPEQAQGHPLDQRSDVFSAGIVLWELLAGERLFKADHPMDSMQRIVQAGIPSLARSARPIPEAVVQLVDKMLSKDPDRRPPDMTEVYRWLKAALVRHYEREAFGARALADFLSLRLPRTPLHPTSSLGVAPAATQPDQAPFGEGRGS